MGHRNGWGGGWLAGLALVAHRGVSADRSLLPATQLAPQVSGHHSGAPLEMPGRPPLRPSGVRVALAEETMKVMAGGACSLLAGN